MISTYATEEALALMEKEVRQMRQSRNQTTHEFEEYIRTCTRRCGDALLEKEIISFFMDDIVEYLQT